MQVLLHFGIYKLPTKTTHNKAAEEYGYGARSWSSADKAWTSADKAWPSAVKA